MPKDEIFEKVIKHLEKSFFNGIKENFRNQTRVLLKELVQEEFKEFHNSFSRLEKTMDMWKNDLDEDRESLRTIRHSTGEHALEMKEVSETIAVLPKKVETAVKDTVENVVSEEVPKAVNDTFTIVGKKVRVNPKPRRLLRWLKFWK